MNFTKLLGKMDNKAEDKAGPGLGVDQEIR